MNTLTSVISDIDISNYMEYRDMFADLEQAIEDEEELNTEELELYEILKEFFE